jgi:hypothetical protein
MKGNTAASGTSAAKAQGKTRTHPTMQPATNAAPLATKK